MQNAQTKPGAGQNVQGTGASSDIHGDKSSLIQERVRMHPNAAPQEIAASLEMDGIFVSTEEVQRVMDGAGHVPTNPR